MKSKFVKDMIKAIPEDIKLFSSIYADLTIRISEALKDQGLSQKDLAEKLDKSPSEISKWLNGEHNFTLRSLCKLESELGIKLIEVPKANNLIVERNTIFSQSEIISWEAKTSNKPGCKIIPITKNVEYTKDFYSLAN